MGGSTNNPTYEEVCSNTTGHVEVVHLEYDSDIIPFNNLLVVFFDCHDPTSWDMQNGDAGEQYRSVIFYHNESQKEQANKLIELYKSEKKYNKDIVTVVREAKTFYMAEDYHQNYYQKSKSLYN